MSFMSELLSRCENSADADKRELVVYVNKLDAIRDSLERQLWMSKNETRRAQNTMAAMKVKLNQLKARIKEEDADLQAADDEIDELHERYRWRKQEEEPAPDWECILYITKNKEVRMDVGRGLEDGERWMPLPDLPKEANP